MMCRDELNRLPEVLPALQAWRKARAERDRIYQDGRSSAASCDEAEADANVERTSEAYDAAIVRAIASQSKEE